MWRCDFVTMWCNTNWKLPDLQIPGQDDELPGGDSEVNHKKISPDEPDGKIKKDVNGNGTINNVPESTKKNIDIERKITTKYENFNASSLQRHTSKSSLASIKSRIMVWLDWRLYCLTHLTLYT